MFYQDNTTIAIKLENLCPHDENYTCAQFTRQVKFVYASGRFIVKPVIELSTFKQFECLTMGDFTITYTRF